MFVRAKEIKGKRYAYLVQNSWTERGTRQKVGRYLGRVFRPEKAKSEGLAGFLGADIAQYVRQSSFRQVVSDLVRLELLNHGLEGFTIDIEGLKVGDDKGKDVVLELNEGFLCGETLKRLMEYKSENDGGFKLADMLLSAGIAIEKDVFIELYNKFTVKDEEKRVEGVKDFYY